VFLAVHPMPTARRLQVGDRHLEFHESWEYAQEPKGVTPMVT